MKKIEIDLIKLSNIPHINQILVGLYELEKDNIIKLKITNDFSSNLAACIMKIGSKNIIIDTEDSANFSALKAINERNIDFYFKRSFLKSEADKYKFKSYPFGLNYDVFNDRLKSEIPLYKRITNILKRIDSINYTNFESKPIINKKNPKICFFTRLWNPFNVEDISQKKERENINKFRINCIRICKEKYGNNFIGGIYKDKFSKKICPDCVIDNSITRKKNFLKIIKQSDVCIATKGLHNSIGWKLAEYVCASKAIISEPLDFSLSGIFLKDKNYIEFSSIDSLISSIDNLISDDLSRYDMMVSNNDYYINNLNPKSIMMNIITKVKNESQSI